MNEEEMRHVLKGHVFCLSRDKQHDNTTDYSIVAVGIDGRRFQRYIGTYRTLSSMDEATFEARVMEKAAGYIGTSRKCAREQCTRRRGKANRVVLTTTFGDVAVYLCDEHFKDFQIENG